jgi:hypothetical protein
LKGKLCAPPNNSAKKSLVAPFFAQHSLFQLVVVKAWRFFFRTCKLFRYAGNYFHNSGRGESKDSPVLFVASEENF